MKKGFRVGALGLLIGMNAVCLAAGGPSQTVSKTTIRGTIVEKRGYVMAGLTVRARNRTTGTEYQTTSRAATETLPDSRDGLDPLRQLHLINDATAEFTFEDVEPGRYVVDAECQGSERI